MQACGCWGASSGQPPAPEKAREVAWKESEVPSERAAERERSLVGESFPNGLQDLQKCGYGPRGFRKGVGTGWESREGSRGKSPSEVVEAECQLYSRRCAHADLCPHATEHGSPRPCEWGLAGRSLENRPCPKTSRFTGLSLFPHLEHWEAHDLRRFHRESGGPQRRRRLPQGAAQGGGRGRVQVAGGENVGLVGRCPRKVR